MSNICTTRYVIQSPDDPTLLYCGFGKYSSFDNALIYRSKQHAERYHRGPALIVHVSIESSSIKKYPTLNHEYITEKKSNEIYPDWQILY